MHFEIPKYPELATKNIWPLVKENNHLMAYFPDMKDSQLPEKEFMFGILSTLNPDAVRELVTAGMKNRSADVQDDHRDLVEVCGELKDAILNLYTMKNKFSNYLKIDEKQPPKEASILNSERKPPKKYATDFNKFIEYEEEQEHNNDGNSHEENKDQNTFS